MISTNVEANGKVYTRYTALEPAMGNCFRVLIGGRLIAIVATEQAAQNFIDMYEATRYPGSDMGYYLHFIPNVGF